MKLKLLLFVLVLGVCFSTGCASASPPATTQSTAAPRVMRLQDAVASNLLEQNDWELDLPSQLSFTSRPLLFGQLAIYDDDDNATATIPVIAVKRDDQTLCLKIDDPRLKNAGWSYIAAGPVKDEMWGVLDATLDDRQPDLVIVHSTDAGETLSITSIPKPHPAAVFDSFCMDREGHGRVSMYVYRDQAGVKHAGYYNYRTTDGGKTWSDPEREPDAMTPATDAPDEPDKKPARPSKV